MGLIQKYGKFIVAVVGFAVNWFVASRTDGRIVGEEWQLIIVAGANAAVVYIAPNYPGNTWIKPAASVVIAVTGYLVANASDGVTGYEWGQLIVLGLTTLGVLPYVPSVSTPEVRRI